MLTTSVRRFSVTTPPPVVMFPRVSSSSTAISSWWATRFTSSHRSLTRGRCRKRSTPSTAGCRSAPAIGPARPWRLVGSRSSSTAWGIGASCRAGRRCRRRAPCAPRRPRAAGRRRVDPGVGVERLALDPEGERPDEDDERPEREEHPGEDGARARTHAQIMTDRENGCLMPSGRGPGRRGPARGPPARSAPGPSTRRGATAEPAAAGDEEHRRRDMVGQHHRIVARPAGQAERARALLAGRLLQAVLQLRVERDRLLAVRLAELQPELLLRRDRLQRPADEGLQPGDASRRPSPNGRRW